MNQYNNQFTMRDLFMNSTLDKVFPQFDEKDRLRNVYSFKEVEDRVQKYLAGVFNAVVTGDGELVVKGKHHSVLNRIRLLQPLIEGLFNNMPKVAQALRNNTSLYLPYATMKQIENIKTSAGKTKVLRLVLDNFQYNMDFGTLNSIKKENPAQFKKNKKAWETKVNYRGLKKV